MLKRMISFAAVAGLVLALAAGTAQAAANLTWDNNASTMNWNTTDANWNGGAATWNTSDNADFTGTATGTITITSGDPGGSGGDNNIDTNTIDFTANGYTIASDGTHGLGKANPNVSTGVTATISAPMDGDNNHSVSVSGGGTLILSGASTFNNEFRITGVGTTAVATTIADAGTLSSIGTGGGTWNLCLYKGVTFKYTGSGGSTDRKFMFRESGTETRTIDASGSGAIVFTGTGNIYQNKNHDVSVGLAGTNAGNNTLNPNLVDTGGTLSLTKSGIGKWILAGVNTYTGDTTVSAGTLTLADDAGLLFVIGATGVNNAILGGGTLNLDGDFTFDLSGAGTNLGDTWQIVDNTNLAETYDPTFSVNGFSESANVWTFDSGSGLYEFDESTGVLTVIPEPATLALVALGLPFVMRRKRR